MFKRILVALKFSPASRSVLEKGIEIARDHGAELHIFHALDYRLQALDGSDPKLKEINEETKGRFDTEVKPLLNDFNHIALAPHCRCLSRLKAAPTKVGYYRGRKPLLLKQ